MLHIVCDVKGVDGNYYVLPFDRQSAMIQSRDRKEGNGMMAQMMQFFHLFPAIPFLYETITFFG